MTPRRALLTALWLAAAGAACKDNSDLARLTAYQTTCLSVRGMSYTQAIQAFQTALQLDPDPPSPPDAGSTCPPQPPLTPVSNADDACNYPDVCQAWWSSVTGNTDLCSFAGCWFGCEARFSSGNPDTAVVCMARFYSGEPCRHGFTGC